MGKPRWLPLEANPEVLNKYVERLGVLNYKFIDVITLDKDYLSFITDKIIAVIMLFPLKETNISIEDHDYDKEMKDIYFCDQTIHNACGTLAVIHAILNNLDEIQLDPNSPLEEFYRETMYMSPEERGKFLEDFEEIKDSHTDSALEGQTAAPSLDDKLDLHFVTLTAKNNAIYELDGRSSYPIRHSALSNTDEFFKEAIEVCRERIKKNPDELRFSIMALAQDKN